MAEIRSGDDHLSHRRPCIEVLSEHLCEGSLGGCISYRQARMLGRYEALIHIIDSMFNEHAKWLKSITRPRGGSRRLTELFA